MRTDPLLERAARGVLPEWAEVKPARYEHMRRVAGLLEEWATALALSAIDRMRWSAAGWLHDALRDAPRERMLPWVDAPFRGMPAAFLHGPAAAGRLAIDGIQDDELLDAIRYHTLGRSRLGVLGRALIAADFLEPGRRTLQERRASLRQRMPGDFDAVVLEVVRARLTHAVEVGSALRPEMVGMWNEMVVDEASIQH